MKLPDLWRDHDPIAADRRRGLDPEHARSWRLGLCGARPSAAPADPSPERTPPSMQFTHLGRSGLSVSRLCLGTMNFGPLTSETDSHKIMDSAHEHGINFFDTANVYGLRSAGVSG